MTFPLLTYLTLAPLFSGIAVLLICSNDRVVRKFAIVFSFVPLALVALAWRNFDMASSALQFSERHAWIPSLGVEYLLGIDGLGLVMILLAAAVVPFAAIATTHINNAKLYYALLLFLQSGLFGTFTALNFFHWFIFWELSLVPAFFLIKLWGGPKRTGRGAAILHLHLRRQRHDAAARSSDCSSRQTRSTSPRSRNARKAANCSKASARSSPEFRFKPPRG
jgi:NADH-quinone oxidoreductase subunit M